MPDNLTFALNLCALTVIVFSANILFMRSYDQTAYRPLASALITLGVVICQPTLSVLMPSWRLISLIFSLPAIMLVAPCFWFYVRALTAEKRWQFNDESTWHLAPFFIAFGVSVVALLLPTDIRHGLLVEGNEDVLTSLNTVTRYFVYALLIITFLLVIGWVLQSGYYFYRTVVRLSQYRLHLKDLFASTEAKEIQWLTFLMIAIGSVWLANASILIVDNILFPLQLHPLLANLILLLMVWYIALWGLRQKPGFEELYDSEDGIQEVLLTDANAQSKYQRSALDEQASMRIASKIEDAMLKDKLYLDASLSLRKLATQTGTSPNYISQTINETLGMNFFDFVNRYRIEDAKQRLLQSSDSVLDIAMNVGFNAKSSFYTAFKKETSTTPSDFRKQYNQLNSPNDG